MAAACREAGAEIRLATRVEAITAGRGAVTGVVAAGEHIACSEVVATTSPNELDALAGNALPERYRHALHLFPRADGAVKADWALTGAVPWLAPEARRAGTVHVGGSVGDLERQTAERRTGRVPEHPFLLVGQQSLADPTRAPAGRHTLWAYSLVPPRVRWAQERESLADRFEDEIERHAPGFRTLILGRAVHGPLDVTGGANDLVHLVRRPTLHAHSTPLRGLVLGGASTPPGGGVHGACGANAARALLRARGRREARRPSARGPR